MRPVTLSLFGLALVIAGACSASSSQTSASPSGTDDLSTDDTGKPSDSGKKKKTSAAKDAGSSVGDASPESSDASTLSACSFNSDCISSERCECADGDCVCKVGKRGTGVSGVDMCVDGNDCESSLCVEANSGTMYCSGACESDKGCGPALPLCAEIAFVGKICIRRNDAGK